MQRKEEFIKLLSDGLSEESTRLWHSFFYNIDQVRLLRDVSTEDALKDIDGGSRWTGSGWKTSRASQRLHSLTQDLLVTAEFNQYRNAWLYCLSMLWNVEVTELTLGRRRRPFGWQVCVRNLENEWKEMKRMINQRGKAPWHWTGMSQAPRAQSSWLTFGMVSRAASAGWT